MVRAHILINGVVQGVGFRYYTARLANKFGVMGYAKNLPDGQVEIEAEGEKSSVMGFIDQVKIGPRHAHISDIKVAWLEPKNYKSFSIY